MLIDGKPSDVLRTRRRDGRAGAIWLVVVRHVIVDGIGTSARSQQALEKRQQSSHQA